MRSGLQLAAQPTRIRKGADVALRPCFVEPAGPCYAMPP